MRSASAWTTIAALKPGSFVAPSPSNWRTSSPPFTASRWKTFWMTTPCFSTGAAETSSADTGRQKAGTVSSLPTTRRSAAPRFAHGRTVRNPSATSVLICWSRTLGTILLLCCICEGRRFFPGHKISPSVGHRITPVDGTDGLFMYQIAKHDRESSCTNDFFVIFV